LYIWNNTGVFLPLALRQRTRTLFCFQGAKQQYSILTYKMQYVIMLAMEKKRKSTTLRLTEQDIQAILKIRQAYGIASDNQAIIYAIHTTARQLEQGLKPQTPNR